MARPVTAIGVGALLIAAAGVAGGCGSKSAEQEACALPSPQTRAKQTWDYLNNWSPDGSMIAFWRRLVPGEAADMWVINADGSEARNFLPSLKYRHDVAWGWQPQP
jgi:hypothetical protein